MPPVKRLHERERRPRTRTRRSEGFTGLDRATAGRVGKRHGPRRSCFRSTRSYPGRAAPVAPSARYTPATFAASSSGVRSRIASAPVKHFCAHRLQPMHFAASKRGSRSVSRLTAR